AAFAAQPGLLRSGPVGRAGGQPLSAGAAAWAPAASAPEAAPLGGARPGAAAAGICALACALAGFAASAPAPRPAVRGGRRATPRAAVALNAPQSPAAAPASERRTGLFIGEATQTKPAEATPILASTEVPVIGSVFAGSTLESAPAAAAAVGARASGRRAAARLVGGRRCRRATSRGATRGSERASRRSAGAALSQDEPIYEVTPPSFDASTLRTEIQCGLRTSSRIKSVNVREFKTRSSAKGSRESTGLFGQRVHVELREWIDTTIVC
ncbi:unnamed protein product, partial [Prorocentrum cordatum]